jgi:hypothetical protein
MEESTMDMTYGKNEKKDQECEGNDNSSEKSILEALNKHMDTNKYLRINKYRKIINLENNKNNSLKLMNKLMINQEINIQEINKKQTMEKSGQIDINQMSQLREGIKLDDTQSIEVYDKEVMEKVLKDIELIKIISSKPQTWCKNCGTDTHTTKTCRQGVKCWYCGKSGHIQRGCRKYIIKWSTCTKCGEQGHTYLACNSMSEQMKEVMTDQCQYCMKWGHKTQQCAVHAVQEYINQSHWPSNMIKESPALLPEKDKAWMEQMEQIKRQQNDMNIAIQKGLGNRYKKFDQVDDIIRNVVESRGRRGRQRGRGGQRGRGRGKSVNVRGTRNFGRMNEPPNTRNIRGRGRSMRGRGRRKF